MDGRAYVRGPSDITRIVTAMPSAAPVGPPVGPYSPVRVSIYMLTTCYSAVLYYIQFLIHAMFNTWLVFDKENKHNCLKPYFFIGKTVISAPNPVFS